MAISMEDYHPLVHQILRGGVNIMDYRRQANNSSPEESQANQSGFNAKRLRWRGEQMGLPDEQLLKFLRFCCYEYSEETPPVSWFAPHSRTVYAQ